MDIPIMSFFLEIVKLKCSQLHRGGLLSIENLATNLSDNVSCTLPHVTPLRAPAFAVSLSPRWDLVPQLCRKIGKIWQNCAVDTANKKLCADVCRCLQHS